MNRVWQETVMRDWDDIIQKLNDDTEYCRLVKSGKVPQLTELLSYAINNTEFYSTIDVPELSRFPVMNKTRLNENYDAISVKTYEEVKTHKMHTSGSTGIPFTVVQNMEKRYRHIADLKYFGELAGYKDHDPMCYLRAKPTATPQEQEEQNIWQLDICNLSEENLTNYYHTMIEKKCVALIAYPSTLDTAINFWLKKFPNNQSYVKSIISTSETLTTETREKLASYFGEDCGIYARYSNTENGILGQETDTEGTYLLNWASYYFEILKLDSDEPAEDGELGRIIVTDLYNKAFPMIRYDTGDVAKLVRPEVGFPYFMDLLGRRMDLIYDTKGEVVSPFLLCRTMRLSKGIEQWQFVQKSDTEYIIKISVTEGHTKPTCEKEIISFRQTLGEDAKISVEYVDEIPVMNSLKRKLIVSLLQK